MDLSKMRETSKELQNPQKTPKEFAVSKEIKAEVNNIFRIVDSEKYSKCQRSWIICDDGKSRPFTLVDNFGNASPFLKLPNIFLASNSEHGFAGCCVVVNIQFPLS